MIFVIIGVVVGVLVIVVIIGIVRYRTRAKHADGGGVVMTASPAPVSFTNGIDRADAKHDNVVHNFADEKNEVEFL